MATSETSVLLTETVKKGGCAAKLPAGELKHILENLKPKALPELAVGIDTLDDAALWDLGDGRFLIQTVDFFTPIVDDPFAFGAIAAANALSDVYAMGGEPKTALTILAFPMATLNPSILFPLMKGANEKIEEAGACLAGGHSIDDDTLKLGFSIAGFVKKELAWKNSGAKPGDKLILTKALGTGTITSALKLKKAKPDWIEAAINSMTLLNRSADLMKEPVVNAATDITGFGLAAHALHVARASSVCLTIEMSRLPMLPGAMECLREKILNRAHRTNSEYIANDVSYDPKLDEVTRWLAVDPQTSGGLLLSVPEKKAAETAKRLKARFPSTEIIGSVGPRKNGGPFVMLT